MADKSKIEWLGGGSTYNPIRAELLEDILDRDGKVLHHKGEIGWFCIKTSPGCKNCYACSMNLWRGNGLAYIVTNLSKVRIFLDEKAALKPLHWKKPRLIFPCSMTDWMADFVRDVWRDRMMAIMALTPQHQYLSLTKQADIQQRYLSDPQLYKRVAAWMRTGCLYPAQVVASEFEEKVKAMLPLKNHWVGVSAENQKYADERIPLLLQTPAAIRWVSAEPLLNQILLDNGETSWLSCQRRDDYSEPPGEHCCTSFDEYGQHFRGIDWVVAGGESGPGARPMHPDWARSLRDQCQAAGVPFFFKQWGEWSPFTDKPQPGDISVLPQPDHAANRRDQSGQPERYSLWNRDLYGSADGTVHRAGCALMRKVGKKAAGRLLDGKEHSEYPEVRR